MEEITEPMTHAAANVRMKELVELGSNGVALDTARAVLGEQRFARLLADPIRKHGPAAGLIYFWNVADYLVQPGLRAEVQSKSLLKRQAVQRGEEMPTGFVTLEEHRAAIAEIERLRERVAELEGCGFDVRRIVEWMEIPNRKEASRAFTASPERQVAYLIEMEERRIRFAKRNKIEESEGGKG